MSGVVGAESTDYTSCKIHQEREGKKNNNLKGLKRLRNIFGGVVVHSLFVGQRAESLRKK